MVTWSGLRSATIVAVLESITASHLDAALAFAEPELHRIKPEERAKVVRDVAYYLRLRRIGGAHFAAKKGRWVMEYLAGPEGPLQKMLAPDC